MFISYFNFFKSLLILVIFIITPRSFLSIVAGKKIFKKKKIFLKKNIDSNFQIPGKKLNFNEINLIARGRSITFYKNDIDLNLPTFFINFYGEEQNLLKELTEKDNFFGVTTDFEIKKLMKKSIKKTILILNGYEKSGYSKFYYKDGQNEIDNDITNDTKISQNSKKIFSNLNNSKLLINFHNDEQQLDIGSALCVLAFFYKISQKINVYGYDHYLTANASTMSYFRLLPSMFNETTKINPKPLSKSFIKSMINYFFIEYFENSKRINFFSFLSNVKKKNTY